MSPVNTLVYTFSQGLSLQEKKIRKVPSAETSTHFSKHDGFGPHEAMEIACGGVSRSTPPGDSITSRTHYLHSERQERGGMGGGREETTVSASGWATLLPRRITFSYI